MATVTRTRFVPERAGKNRLAAKWNALIAYGTPAFHKILDVVYRLERHRRPSGNPRRYRVEDLSEDQANEVLKAIQRQKLELDRELATMRERLAKARKHAKNGTLLSHEEVFQTLSDTVKNRRQEG